MTPERHAAIGELYHQALDRPREQRARFLDEACRGDLALREEVASLLSAHDSASGFIETPAIAVAAAHVAAGRQSLTAGATIGPYEVRALLGRGGMGEVYRAHDSRLGRDVALKILPAEFARDTQRLARFRREAQVLALLNHPHIAQIYGFEENDARQALVLELVEGSTLSERIAEGALPLEEALAAARQIAEALEAAHERGVIHRDLKPSNITLRRDGSVKVLDFGLARALPANAPGVTDTGVIVGTAAYMSPEQAKGLPVDKRCDIWAFGCVLFELLTGRQAFPGSSAAEIVAAVLERSPDWSMLPPATPPGLRRLLARCLEKDPSRRLRDIGDARLELEEVAAAGSRPSSGALPVAAAAARATARSSFIVGSLAVVTVAMVAWFASRKEVVSPGPVVRLSIPLSQPPPVDSAVAARTLAISEDGARVAYRSGDQLWVRRLDQQESKPVMSGRTTAGFDPFFSSNGEWLGFFDNTGLYKVSALGGVPVLLVQGTQRFAGGTWRDGTIVYASTEGLFEVSENGGTPRLLAKPDPARNERLFARPQFTTDGHAVIFTIVPDNATDDPIIAAMNLRNLEISTVLKGGAAARDVPTGHLVFADGQNLKAVAFDRASLRPRGDVVSLKDIVLTPTARNGAAQFSLSASGTLVFMTPRDSRQPLTTLSWMDHRGKEEPLPLVPGRYNYARVSPDGGRLALDIAGDNRDIWILNLSRQSVTRLTDGPTEDLLPVWSRDGSRVFFGSDRAGMTSFDVYSQAADGATPARVEFSGPGTQLPLSMTPDGRHLLVTEDFKTSSLLVLGPPGRIEPLLHGAFNYWNAVVSPDGKWVAYESNESGQQMDIFIRPFPDVSRRREKVSLDGGRFPLWGLKGSDELYYLDFNGSMMAASVTLSPDLAVGAVKKLFAWEKPPRSVSGRFYDISPIDGRFLLTKHELTANSTDMWVVLNWQEELKRLVPAR